MITGMHAIIYSRDAAADRAFFRDVLGFPCVDAGDGWLIFAAPPSELAFHPAENDGKHELYLMCDDVKAEVDQMAKKGIGCGPITDEGWGLLTSIRLPGGSDLGLYEPRHAIAHGAAA
jgi:catechol 2,3-dioxygenase-like lactoylglutathione lyase family enzyme